MSQQAPPFQPTTAWHPLFGWVLRAVLPKESSQIHAEFQLNLLPLRNDYVVIQTHPEMPQAVPRGPLSRVLALFGWFTIVELTGPTSALRREDWLYSMGCAQLFCAAQGIWDPRHVHVIRVASRLTEPFVQQVRACGGQMATLAPGIHQIKGPAHPCYCVETELVQEPILRLFSPTFLKDPKGVYDLLSEEERAIFIQVYREVEQFKADPQAALKYADYEVFKMSMQEMVTSLLKGLPTEEVLRHYDAQEVLRHYDAQEVLRHYDAQERLKGLPAQERLEGLPAEEILAGLSPEARERLRRLLSSS